jgi:hypothetical protein
MRRRGSSSWQTALLGAALGALLLASSGCVESGAYDKATSQLEAGRITLAQKDAQIRAYEWQLATLAQQLREGQQRADAREREREGQIQQLTAANSTLAERVKRLELERADLLQAESLHAADTGSPRGLRPDEVRRLMAASSAQNLRILEELARIEHALATIPVGGRDGAGPRPPDPAGSGGARAGTGADVIDPWGFGSRK